MRTSIQIDPELYKELKISAIQKGVRIREEIDKAFRLYLELESLGYNNEKEIQE